MKSQALFLTFIIFAIVSASSSFARADRLDDIRKRGTIIVGIRETTPPFGFKDPKTGQMTGYDVEMANLVAAKIGVRMEFKSETSASRIPDLKEDHVDLIAATLTKTPERAAEVDFSYAYFLSGQRFLAKKGRIKSAADLRGLKVGTGKGSTAETTTTKTFPEIKLTSFADHGAAFQALQAGTVEAVTTDEAILAGFYADLPKKEDYEISELEVTQELYGMAVKKGEKRLLEQVDAALQTAENSFEASRLFQKWFGPQTKNPLRRRFKITDKK